MLVSNSKNCLVHAPHTKCKKCVTFRACTRSVQFTVTVCLCSLCRVIGRWLFFLFKVRIINYAYNLHTTHSSRTFSLSLSRISYVFLFYLLYLLLISHVLSCALSLSLFVFCLRFLFFSSFFRFFSFLEDPIYNPHIISHKD